MFIKKKKIFQSCIKKKIKLKLSELHQGLNVFNEYFILYERDKIKIYDRVCDHAGGKLISKNNKIICPVHNWEFCIKKKKYTNGFEKKTIKYKLAKETLEFFLYDRTPNIKQYETNKKNEIKIEFINHACVKFEHKKFKFATDPWCYGPAFANGWWLKKKSKNNWQAELDSCDFLYISHNHSDHLHLLTLKNIEKTKKIIIPKFSSDSTGLLLEDMGFQNVQRLDFNVEYKMRNSPLNLSILKSGDFREDSGLYFSIGNFTSLMDVDSNNINFLKLPNVTLYASSFGSGASGYPLMFDNLNLTQKKKIIQANRNFILTKKKKNMLKIKPKYFLPYASYFSEDLVRDKFIKKLNKKNKIDNYLSFCKNNKISILNTEINNQFHFKDTKLKKEYNDIKVLFKDKSPKEYLKRYKSNYSIINEKYLKDYFENSNFSETLELFIDLTDDNFKSIGKFYFINFSLKKNTLKKFTQLELNNRFNSKSYNNRKLYLKIRKESFLSTIYNKLPWDDLLIGFACKVNRIPNIYNAKFWFHFSNNYVSKMKVKSKINCNGCEGLLQFLDKNNYLKKI